MEHLSVTALQRVQLNLEDNESPLQFEEDSQLLKSFKAVHQSYSYWFLRWFIQWQFLKVRLPCIVAR